MVTHKCRMYGVAKYNVIIAVAVVTVVVVADPIDVVTL